MPRRDTATGQYVNEPERTDNMATGGFVGEGPVPVPTVEHIGTPGAGAAAFTRGPLDPNRMDSTVQPVIPDAVGPGAQPETATVQHLTPGGSQGSGQIASMFRRGALQGGRQSPAPGDVHKVVRRAPGE